MFVKGKTICAVSYTHLINEVKAYQLESPATVKLPKLSPTETELVREEMTTVSYTHLMELLY